MKKNVVEVSLKLVDSFYFAFNLGLDLDKLKAFLSKVVHFIKKLPWYVFLTYCAYHEILRIIGVWGVMK